MKRNANSDFKVLVTLKNPLFFGKPFSFAYYTDDKANAYVANWDGEKSDTGNVFKADEQGKQYFIVFNSGEYAQLGTGVVSVERRFTIEDAQFADGHYNKVVDEPANIELVAGAGDDDELIESVVGINILKPIKGIDYYTAADKEEIINSIKSEIETAIATAVEATLQEAKEYADSLHTEG